MLAVNILRLAQFPVSPALRIATPALIILLAKPAALDTPSKTENALSVQLISILLEVILSASPAPLTNTLFRVPPLAKTVLTSALNAQKEPVFLVSLATASIPKIALCALMDAANVQKGNALLATLATVLTLVLA